MDLPEFCKINFACSSPLDLKLIPHTSNSWSPTFEGEKKCCFHGKKIMICKKKCKQTIFVYYTPVNKLGWPKNSH